VLRDGEHPAKALQGEQCKGNKKVAKRSGLGLGLRALRHGQWTHRLIGSDWGDAESSPFYERSATGTAIIATGMEGKSATRKSWRRKLNSNKKQQKALKSNKEQ
jgi:hypothetical protein